MDDLELEIAERKRNKKRQETLHTFLHLLGNPNSILDLMDARPEFMRNCANAILKETEKEITEKGGT